MLTPQKITKYLRKNGEKAVWCFDFSDTHYGCSRLRQGYDGQATHIVVHLLGKKSSIEIYGIYQGKKSRSADVGVTMLHRADDTRSRVYFRAALDDTSRVAFSGKIVVPKNVKNADTRVEAKALLLSEKSSAALQPDLEIESDTAKASHGASIGHLNPRDMFYLATRGMEEKKAKKMLISGFLQTHIV